MQRAFQSRADILTFAMCRSHLAAVRVGVPDGLGAAALTGRGQGLRAGRGNPAQREYEIARLPPLGAPERGHRRYGGPLLRP